MDAPRVSVVMPAHNEQGALPRVVADIEAALDRWPHEIIIVDDGSDDRTWDVIRSLKRDRPTLKGIRLSRNFGHQAALVAGLRASTGSAVIMMDADGQHPPEMLPEFLRLWEAGAPIVQGIRTSSDGEGPIKR